MRRFLIRVVFTLMSMCTSKSSSEQLNEWSTSKRDILLHTIHLATGSGSHGEGGYEGGGSGSSTPKVPSSTAVIPVITGGAAIRNHHGRHHSEASRIRGCPKFQPLVTMMLALCCILYKQDLVPDMTSGLDEYFISVKF